VAIIKIFAFCGAGDDNGGRGIDSPCVCVCVSGVVHVCLCVWCWAGPSVCVIRGMLSSCRSAGQSE